MWKVTALTITYYYFWYIAVNLRIKSKTLFSRLLNLHCENAEKLLSEKRFNQVQLPPFLWISLCHPKSLIPFPLHSWQHLLNNKSFSPFFLSSCTLVTPHVSSFHLPTVLALSSSAGQQDLSLFFLPEACPRPKAGPINGCHVCSLLELP